MDGKRWKPLVGTPSKSPVPSNILIPDPSPARSMTSDADSLTMLPPSPQGSFIHRRRQGQYVPRPPVWKVYSSDQEFGDIGPDARHITIPRSDGMGWPSIQLPGISIDEQVRKMADVFYERPFVVNMMTSQETRGELSNANNVVEEESEVLQSRLEQLQLDPRLKVPREQHIDSGNPSVGTTAIGSKRSSKLPEDNTTTNLPESVDVTSDAGGRVAPVNHNKNDLQAGLANDDSQPEVVPRQPGLQTPDAICPSPLYANEATQRIHQPANRSACLQSEQGGNAFAEEAVQEVESFSGYVDSDSVQPAANDATHPAVAEQGALTRTAQELEAPTDDATELNSRFGSGVAHSEQTQQQPGSVRDEVHTTSSHGTYEETSFVRRAANDAAHLPMARYVPRSLRNTDEATIAGLDNIPSAPADQPGDSDATQGPTTRKGKRKSVFGFFNRPNDIAASSSTLPNQTGRTNEKSQGSGRRENISESVSRLPAEPRRVVVQDAPEEKKKTVRKRFKDWASRTIGRKFKDTKPRSTTPAVPGKGILKPQSTTNAAEALDDGGKEKEGVSEGKSRPREPARSSDTERPLIDSTTQSQPADGATTSSHESSSVDHGVQAPGPSNWDPTTGDRTRGLREAAATWSGEDSRRAAQLAQDIIDVPQAAARADHEASVQRSIENSQSSASTAGPKPTPIDSLEPATGSARVSTSSDPFKDTQADTSTDDRRWSWVPSAPEVESSLATCAETQVQPATPASLLLGTTPTTIATLPALIPASPLLPPQAPLADITNRSAPREQSIAGLSNTQPPAATTRRNNDLSDTRRQRPANYIPEEEEEEEEEIPAPPRPGSSFGPRPNELREEILRMNPRNPALGSR